MSQHQHYELVRLRDSHLPLPEEGEVLVSRTVYAWGEGAEFEKSLGIYEVPDDLLRQALGEMQKWRGYRWDPTVGAINFCYKKVDSETGLSLDGHMYLISWPPIVEWRGGEDYELTEDEYIEYIRTGMEYPPLPPRDPAKDERVYQELKAIRDKAEPILRRLELQIMLEEYPPR